MNANSVVTFLDLLDALQNLGRNGRFELLLYIRLSDIGKPFEDVTVGELIAEARAAGEAQAKPAADKIDYRGASGNSSRLL
jgi:hypothetical protein